MKREDLKNLELSDEQIDKIMGLHGQTVNDLNGKVSTLEAENQSLNDQVAQSNKQLEDLKESTKDNESLQTQIQELQKANEDLKSDGEAKLAETKKGYALELALRDAGARNVKSVLPLLDQDTIKLKDGAITGLEEQLKTVKEENNFLFQGNEEPDGNNKQPQITTGGNPNPGNGEGAKTMVEKIQQNLEKGGN